MSDNFSKQIFLNPLEDEPFKIIFGQNNKRNMINLLRAVLNRDIDDIEYIDTEKLGICIGESRSQYDLSVLFADGTRCIVEMQKTNLRYFNYRSVYYCSHLVQLQARLEREEQRKAQLKKDKKPFWNYHFKPVYMIGILEHGSEEMDEALSQQSDYLFHYRNIEKNCGADMKVDVNFLFLHLDKFNKSETESKSLLDQFAYALKHMKQDQKQPDGFSSEEIQNLYDSARLANLSPEEAHNIEIHKNMTTENDILVALSEERERALAEGITKGIAEGEAKGRAEGKTEGEVNVAKAFLASGMSAEEISRITGLPKESFCR